MEDWLRAAGLGQWIAAFRDHGITLDQVADLTEDDLRELGLTIGDRRRFQGAVASLKQSQLFAGDAVVAPPATRAERRPLTIMFVDLVNSSALGERLDAEDLLEVIRRYREFCGGAVTRFGGRIARLIGDGILAYFCYPIATENDPERAVRAALGITRGIGSLETPAGASLNVRIGIATGRVIVSDLVAGGQRDKSSIIGSTPNLAARLQGFAPPGGIVIAEATHARLGGAFICDEMRARELKGFAQSHNAWLVIAESPAFGRDQAARHAWRLTPLYDRLSELRALAECWDRARAGNGGAVLVVGEAGIGKSRLVEHFLAASVDDRAQVVRLAASPFDEDSALHPVITFVRNAAELAADDPREIQLAKLGSVLAGDAAARAAALPVLAELIGIALEDSPMGSLSPAQLRERILSVLVEQMLFLGRRKPLCVVVEDLHWIDPTSRELLQRMIEGIAGEPVMLLLTARDEFEAPWKQAGMATVLRLAPLSPNDVAEMVRSLFSEREIPEHLGRIIARRTDGVPLFVEEVARSLLATQPPDELDDTSAELPSEMIPASLHESLMARLDMSGVAKTIAQIAAVIGRSVRRDMLASVAALPETALEQPLSTLGEAGILLREASDGGRRYTFRHALLRDAAYDSLLRDDRRELHLRVARALTVLDPQAAEQQPALLAMHLTEGNAAEEAAPHWLEAGRRSLARSALVEATRLLRRGLDALEKLPASASVLDYRLRLSALLGPALIALKGPASPEAQELYGSAFALAHDVPEHASHFPITWGWWRTARDFGVKKQRASTLMARAISRDDPELLLQAHHCNWATHYDTGDFPRCRAHIDLGLAIYRKGDFRHHARLYGNHDALVCGLGALAQVDWMQGRPLSGLARERESLVWAKEMDHVGTHVHALDVRILHHSHRREHETVFDLAGELVTLTSEHGLVDHRAKGLIFRGWTVAMRDDPAAGLRTIEEGLARQREIGTLEDFPVYVCLHAEALARAGEPERAVEELQRDRCSFEQLGLLFWMPEMLRMLAEVTLTADPASVAAAQDLLRQSAELADSQGVPMLGLRTAVTAARLEVQLGERAQAARRLAAALSRIVEDDGSPEVAEARALLAAWRAGTDGLPSDCDGR